MKVVVLGTAAGGGFPQWNCACDRCAAARLGRVPSRTQDCIAVSARGRDWYLVNVSPDIRTQLIGSPLTPGPGPRDMSLRGAVLSDAELDHAVGLLLLREATEFRVWAPSAVVGALSPVRDIVDRYHGWEWPVVDSSSFELGGLRWQVFPLHDKPPRYAAPGPGPWAVAYRITDPATGGSLVYAPCLGMWPPGFDEFVEGAGYVLLDGTFYSANEMAATTGDHRDQRGMGHLPIVESLPMLRPGTRWVYTHLNNTNPLLDRQSPEWDAVLSAGADVVVDGTEIDL
jgi:pyrroloquinoline quinone biosynthesis protein B